MPPFIFKKKNKNGHTYYYLGENKWINGKSERVWEIYLGPAHKIRERFQQLDQDPEPLGVLQFGGVAALLSLAKQFELAEIIDNKIKNTPHSPTLSPGTYFLLHVINRCLHPCSKNRLLEWVFETSLARLFPLRKKQLKSQQMWYHLSYFTEENILSIHEEFSQKIITALNLEVTHLLYDPSNFCTYIAAHPENTLPQYGHSKSGQKNLRQINYAVLATLEFGIPLFHYTYSGNINDAESFKAILPKMLAYLGNILPPQKDITIILDKGNNSPEIFKVLEGSSYHFVGSLRPSAFSDLIEIPLPEFPDTFMDSYGELVHAIRVEREVYGKQRIVVVAFNEALKSRQWKRVEARLDKTVRELTRFQQEKLNVKKWRTEEACVKKINALLKKAQVSDLIAFQVIGEFGKLQLTYAIDTAAVEKTKNRLGKIILFTDQKTWSNQMIIESYKDKWQIEEDFRCLKSPDLIREMPMFSWTDPQIRIHVFSCIVALTFLRILQRKSSQAGIHLSPRKMVEELEKMREILLKLPFQNKIIRKLVRLNQTQQKLFEVFNLAEFL